MDLHTFNVTINEINDANDPGTGPATVNVWTRGGHKFLEGKVSLIATRVLRLTLANGVHTYVDLEAVEVIQPVR